MNILSGRGILNSACLLFWVYLCIHTHVTLNEVFSEPWRIRARLGAQKNRHFALLYFISSVRTPPIFGPPLPLLPAPFRAEGPVPSPPGERRVPEHRPRGSRPRPASLLAPPGTRDVPEPRARGRWGQRCGPSRFRGPTTARPGDTSRAEPCGSRQRSPENGCSRRGAGPGAALPRGLPRLLPGPHPLRRDRRPPRGVGTRCGCAPMRPAGRQGPPSRGLWGARRRLLPPAWHITYGQKFPCLQNGAGPKRHLRGTSS